MKTTTAAQPLRRLREGPPREKREHPGEPPRKTSPHPRAETPRAMPASGTRF